MYLYEIFRIMGLLHYFSADEDKRAQFIFNLIAPVYGLIDHAISDNYREITDKLNEIFPLRGKKVLDVGTGTGGWISALARYPLKEAVGVDFSGKMIRQARKKHPGIRFEKSDGKDLHDFQDGTFDIVTCSFMMHGMRQDHREKVLMEMIRVAGKAVVVHDFYGDIAWPTRLLESLERSDYKNFLRSFKQELEIFSTHVRIVSVNNGNGLYIGWK